MSNFNNTVRDAYGEIEGFRCWECGNVFQYMWGDTCNGCREKERRHRELLEVAKRNTVSES
jgi:hypothetical protein